MNKRVILYPMVAMALITSVMGASVYAADEPEYKGQFSYKVSASESGKSFESAESGKNAILVTGGTVNFSKSIITKSGDGAGGVNTDYYGMDAAVLATKSSKIKLMDSTVTTKGKRSDAIFSFGDSTIDASDSIITTTKDSSSALTVTAGGTIFATNLVVEAKGKSPLMYFGKGGGTMEITNGIYKATGSKSPMILIQPEASAKEITGVDIKLEKVALDNTTNGLIKIDSTNQGRSRKKGANITVSVMKTALAGNITSDEISSLTMMFSKRTELIGSINKDKKAKDVTLMVDQTSRVILTADSYVKMLKNSVSDNSNIYANGHKLFVDGKEVKTNTAKYEEWEYDFDTETTEPTKPQVVIEEEKKDKSGLYILLGVSGAAFLVSLSTMIFLIKRSKNRAQRKKEQEVIAKASSNTMKKPWERV